MKGRRRRTNNLQPIRIVEEPADRLADYATIPAVFQVRKKVDTTKPTLPARKVEPAYAKDYDAIPGNRPADWATQWDLGKWRFLAAFAGEQRVGGVALVIDAAEVEPAATEHGDDLAMLWDIRVDPEFRRLGIGRKLLAAAERLARAAGRRRMMIETQDINVPACRLYAKARYELMGIDRFVYPSLHEEYRLTWIKRLRRMV